jgi:hypothetical protein
LIDPAIREHGGRVVQTAGDSLLVVFDSIDGAVRCAVKVQQHVPVYDGDQPSDRRIRFRIGINIGDVIAHGTDLHGDGVNVAARLEAECPPGGICVSRAVRDHVHGRLDLAFEWMGPLTLKNIAGRWKRLSCGWIGVQRSNPSVAIRPMPRAQGCAHAFVQRGQQELRCCWSASRPGQAGGSRVGQPPFRSCSRPLKPANHPDPLRPMPPCRPTSDWPMRHGSLSLCCRSTILAVRE